MARELTPEAAGRALAGGFFNLVRRGADGSLAISADKWRAAFVSESRIEFVAQDPDAPGMSIEIGEVERITWDQLPRQEIRSQVRFRLLTGDLLTFSGQVDLNAVMD